MIAPFIIDVEKVLYSLITLPALSQSRAVDTLWHMAVLTFMIVPVHKLVQGGITIATQTQYCLIICWGVFRDRMC